MVEYPLPDNLITIFALTTVKEGICSPFLRGCASEVVWRQEWMSSFIAFLSDDLNPLAVHYLEEPEGIKMETSDADKRKKELIVPLLMTLGIFVLAGVLGPLVLMGLCFICFGFWPVAYIAIGLGIPALTIIASYAGPLQISNPIVSRTLMIVPPAYWAFVAGTIFTNFNPVWFKLLSISILVSAIAAFAYSLFSLSKEVYPLKSFRDLLSDLSAKKLMVLFGALLFSLLVCFLVFASTIRVNPLESVVRPPNSHLEVEGQDYSSDGVNQHNAASSSDSMPDEDSNSTIPPDAIEWSKAKQYIGKTVTLYGSVKGSEYARTSNGKPTFIDVGADYPSKNRLSVTIWGKNRDKFSSAPESLYESKTIAVTGKVYLYDGVCHVEVSSPDQITVLY